MEKQKTWITKAILFTLSATYCVLMLILLLSGPINKITDMNKFKSACMGFVLFFVLIAFSMKILYDLEKHLRNWYSSLVFPLAAANVMAVLVILACPDKLLQAFFTLGLPIILLYAIFTYVNKTITNDNHSKREEKISDGTTAKPNLTQSTDTYRKHPAKDWFQFIYTNR